MKIAFFLVSLILTGCSSARMSDSKADDLFRSGQYDAAAEHLDAGVKDQGPGGRDVLLYMLDEGLALHMAGKIDQSEKIFAQADKMAEIKDYTSLSTEAATLLVSDNIKDYKAEEFEYVLISTYLAINYALAGDHEGAQVESRRVNRKIEMLVTQGKRQYELSAFARYLSGIIFEADGDWNNALVSYKQTRDLKPQMPGIGKDLWRMAWLNHDHSEMKDFDEAYQLTEADHVEAAKLSPKSGNGEIIVVYENGISPIKRPNPNYEAIPKFYPRTNPAAYAQVLVDGEFRANTYLLDNIEHMAIENLDQKFAGIIAKKIAGAVAKEVVAKQVENVTHSELARFLTEVALFAGDKADLRSWNLLPQSLQVARVTVAPGVHTVAVNPVGGHSLPTKTVSVAAGQKIFVSLRYMP